MPAGGGVQQPAHMIERVAIEDVCVQMESMTEDAKQKPLITKSEDGTIRRLVASINRKLNRSGPAKIDRQGGIMALLSARPQDGSATWLLQVADNAVEWSAQMHALFEMDGEEIQPDLDLTLQLAQSVDRPKLKRALEDARSHGRVTSCDWRSRSGGRGARWFWTEFRPECEAGNKVTVVHATCQDITPRTGIDGPGRQDFLTGLANRAGLTEALSKIIADAGRADIRIAALCFDPDGLRTINDLYGYGRGDEVLREIAKRLNLYSRDTDLIARLESDEFVIIQVGGEQPGAALALAERLLAALTEPFNLSCRAQEQLTASIGIAFCPEDADAPDTLLLRAAYALNQAKQNGRNGFAVYSSEMEQDQRAKLRLEQDLRAALRHGEFRLVYQPLFTAETRGVTGFEALLRWTSPEHGVVPPDVFIPIAERIGLMHELGEWVIREACREAACWTMPLKIAVNVSPTQIHQGALADKIKAILKETGLASHRLEIEITETILLKNTETAIATLQRIRDIGVQIAIDDFGTGYSSLATLRAFPFDKLKVDRSFIRDLGQTADALAIVEAILGLSRGLHLPVVAEGVETEEQAEILRRCGCEELQGYLLSKPLPREKLRDLVDKAALNIAAN